MYALLLFYLDAKPYQFVPTPLKLKFWKCDFNLCIKYVLTYNEILWGNIYVYNIYIIYTPHVKVLILHHITRSYIYVITVI